ncbi:hypothetical protein GCM10011444_17150 [Winogradskyella haliclonae]|uniref:Uncharacterized protein n=1 Tax=Winogradskyella haliclonae TaxID=2048558 RepID=A0ABQ2BZP6_9FLAO|nr:hypothetical protein GCM10011444_17150 [Winogradskyella haliclonae]
MMLYEHKITLMAKIYSNCNPKNIQLNPKKETVDFLLNYSKALRVNCYNNMKFEALLN